jgi:iron(III) transport system ATP-binding protein
VPDVHVEGLAKSFGDTRVLSDVSFTVNDKEFVTLLGPSGCGKTTTLMSIAGFEKPDAGRIVCGGQVFVDVEAKTSLPAEQRNLGIVFQSYAVWPHMTVAQNVGFPLRIRRLKKAAVKARVHEVLETVELGDYADRYPYQLSGGQQQRVALARALSYSPGILLLDEPFSNLDAKLRERARTWLKNLQTSLGLTTIFVTHDQDEALSLSDRVLVMKDGRILRSGSPEEIYRQPGERFVAEFVGQCNFVTGRARRNRDRSWSLMAEDFPGGIALRDDPRLVDGQEATVAIRPEDIEIIDGGTTSEGWAGVATDASYLGDHYDYRVQVGTSELMVQARQRLADGSVRVAISPAHATLVDSEDDQRLHEDHDGGQGDDHELRPSEEIEGDGN